MKFLVDQNVSPEVAQLLTAAGHNALHLRDRAMQRATDQQVLDFASSRSGSSFRLTPTSGFFSRDPDGPAHRSSCYAEGLNGARRNKLDSSSTISMTLRTTSNTGASWCSLTSTFGSDASRSLQPDQTDRGQRNPSRMQRRCACIAGSAQRTELESVVGRA